MTDDRKWKIRFEYTQTKQVEGEFDVPESIIKEGKKAIECYIYDEYIDNKLDYAETFQTWKGFCLECYECGSTITEVAGFGCQTNEPVCKSCLKRLNET